MYVHMKISQSINLFLFSMVYSARLPVVMCAV